MKFKIVITFIKFNILFNEIRDNDFYKNEISFFV